MIYNSTPEIRQPTSIEVKQVHHDSPLLHKLRILYQAAGFVPCIWLQGASSCVNSRKHHTTETNGMLIIEIMYVQCQRDVGDRLPFGIIIFSVNIKNTSII